MTVRTGVLVSLALASGVVASAALSCPTPPDAIELASENDHAPLAFAQMETPPVSAPFALTVIFCQPDEQIEALAFDAVMPAHRHGMNFTVDVSEVADNRFEVSNVVFHMPGLWQFQVEAEAAGKRYSYSAEVPLR